MQKITYIKATDLLFLFFIIFFFWFLSYDNPNDSELAIVNFSTDSDDVDKVDKTM